MTFVSRRVILPAGDCHQEMINWRHYTRNTNNSLAVCWSLSPSDISRVVSPQSSLLCCHFSSGLCLTHYLSTLSKDTVVIAVTTHCWTFYQLTIRDNDFSRDPSLLLARLLRGPRALTPCLRRVRGAWRWSPGAWPEQREESVSSAWKWPEAARAGSSQRQAPSRNNEMATLDTDTITGQHLGLGSHERSGWFGHYIEWIILNLRKAAKWPW